MISRMLLSGRIEPGGYCHKLITATSPPDGKVPVVKQCGEPGRTVTCPECKAQWTRCKQHGGVNFGLDQLADHVYEKHAAKLQLTIEMVQRDSQEPQDTTVDRVLGSQTR